MTKVDFRFRVYLPEEDAGNAEIQVWVDEFFDRNDEFSRSLTEWVEEAMVSCDLYFELRLPEDAIYKSWQVLGHGTLENNGGMIDDYEEELSLTADMIREEPEHRTKLTWYRFVARYSRAKMYSMDIVAVNETTAIALAEEICEKAGLKFESITAFVSSREDN